MRSVFIVVSSCPTKDLRTHFVFISVYLWLGIFLFLETSIRQFEFRLPFGGTRDPRFEERKLKRKTHIFLPPAAPAARSPHQPAGGIEARAKALAWRSRGPLASLAPINRLRRQTDVFVCFRTTNTQPQILVFRASLPAGSSEHRASYHVVENDDRPVLFYGFTLS